MIIFKTRHEVKRLQTQLDNLEAMLVANLGIRFTMEHFRQYQEKHPNATSIPVSDGEWYHFGDMMQPSNPAINIPPANLLQFRGISLDKKEDI